MHIYFHPQYFSVPFFLEFQPHITSRGGGGAGSIATFPVSSPDLMVTYHGLLNPLWL